MVIKLTFDTNCILRDEEDKKRSYYSQIKVLESLREKGFVKITKTDVQDTEIGNFEPRLKKSREFQENVGVFVLGHSKLGHGVLSSKEEGEKFVELNQNQKTTKKENDVRDVMVLHTHKKYNGDFLITNNVKDFIFNKLETKIINPEKLDINILNNISSENKLREYLEKAKE